MIYHFPCFPISIAISANRLETDRDRHHERPTRQCQEWTISTVNTEVADRRLAMQSGDFLKIWFQCLSHLFFHFLALSRKVNTKREKYGNLLLLGKRRPLSNLCLELGGGSDMNPVSAWSLIRKRCGMVLFHFSASQVLNLLESCCDFLCYEIWDVCRCWILNHWGLRGFCLCLPWFGFECGCWN